MRFSGKKIGLCVTGSFCTLDRVPKILNNLKTEGALINVIMSDSVYENDTRFTQAFEFRKAVETVTGTKVIHTVVEAEPIGPQKLFDIIVVAPCTGNTLAKLANGITDTAVTMACKAQLRNERPVLLALSTNDGLGANGKNIGILLEKKNVYFVPFLQDDCVTKPRSLVADFTAINKCIEEAFEGKQTQPIIVGAGGNAV